MKQLYIVFSSFFLIYQLSSCGNGKRTNYSEGYEPSKMTLEVLANMKENKLHGPDSIVYPGIVSSLLYQGYQNAGREFAEHTVNTLEYVSADTYHQLSVQNLKNGNYADAYKYVSKAAEMDPKEHAGYFGWTLLYYYRDYPKALEYLELYDDFTPNFSDFPSGENIHYMYGLAHLQLNNLEEALNEFNTYIDEETAIDAESFIDLAAFVHKGRVCEKLNRNSEALQAYKKAIELNERCVEAYYFLADLEYRLTNFEDAASHVKKAESLYADYRVRDVYVELFHEVYPEQIENLKKLIRAESENE